MENRKSRVNIKSLKLFAYEKLPEGSPLREVLLVENDEITVEEFLIKMDLWLKLSRKL